MTQPSPEQFARDFPVMFNRSAFRYEGLSHYVAANEAEPYRRFLTGQPQDPAWREPWKELVREARLAGKTMARVHAVSEPLSPYLRFELTCAYPANVKAGEQVRILRRRDWLDPHLPPWDFWLFDDRQAAVLTYDSAGNWTGVRLTDDQQEVRLWCRARDLAMEHSVPLADFIRSLGMQEAV